MRNLKIQATAFDEKCWIEQHQYFPTIDENKLKSVFYFSLIWNLFEKKCCGQFARIEKHPEELSRQLHCKINYGLLNEIYCYFKNRYIENGSIKQIFKNFKFARNADDNNEFKRKVQECLLKIEPEPGEKLEALLLIAFRLRNNLFHGTKEVARLYEQNENFYQINRLLTAVIEAQEQSPGYEKQNLAQKEEQNA